MYEGNILRKFVDYEIQTGNKTTGGKLGFPITDPYETQSISGAKGTVQRFIYGYIIDWSAGTYRVELGFHDIYQSLDEWLTVGFSLSDEQHILLQYQTKKDAFNTLSMVAHNGTTRKITVLT